MAQPTGTAAPGSTASGATWSAPVRYAEVDQQGIVFNAHYLLYCDEAMDAFCRQRGLGDLAAAVRLVSSTLTWQGPARHGDVVTVEVGCTRVGRTSLDVHFLLTASGRPCCTADTVYVHAAPDGTPQPVTDEQRARLTMPG